MLKNFLRNSPALGAGLLLIASLVTIIGCGANELSEVADSSSDAVAVSGVHITGRVHGGAFPIQAAHIELWQTGTGSWNTSTNSYAPSFFGTSTNSNYIAATTSAATGDGSGRPPGYFDFGSQTLNCTNGSYVYLTTTGGESVANKANENDSVIQVAVIGKCQSLNNAEVYLSELSTIAAAYALPNFISIDTDPNTNLQRVNITAPTNNTATGACTGTGTAMTCTAAGMANGFANALNLVDTVRTDGSFPTGRALTTLPGNSGAIAPSAMVNTLGNVLQSCVDSGPSTVAKPSSFCSTLFGYTPTGYNASSSPTAGAPTNTLQAAINIARNPSTNVSTLYSLASPNGPFSTPLSSAPSSFTLAILYPAAAVGDTNFTKPVDVALDAKDNVYVAYTRSGGNGAVAGLSASGASLFSAAQPTLPTNLLNPSALAVDPSGRVWVSDNTANATNLLTVGNITGFTASGTYYNTYTMPYGHAAGIAFDTSGNMFATRDSTDTNVDDYFYKAGSYTYTQAGTKTGTPLLRAAVDSYGTLKAVGGSTFLTMAPVPATNTATGRTCASAGKYAESSVTLDTTGGMGIAIDSRSGNYTTFLPIKNELGTGNVTIASGQPTQCWNTTTTYNNYEGSLTTNSATGNAAILDGSGNLFWNNASGLIYELANAEANEGASGGALGGSYVSMAPCFLTSGSTVCSYPTSLAGMAVDSSGAMWTVYAPSSGAAYVVQVFGLAAPTWPLLSYAKSGVSF